MNTVEEDIKTFVAKDLMLYNDYPKLKYFSRQGGKSGTHWGQRKLLISEILFLSLYYKKHLYPEGIVCVYAGAAPGHHLLILLDLFPDIFWELYDPRDVNPQLKNRENVKAYKKYFTNEDAEKYQDMDNVFLFVILD